MTTNRKRCELCRGSKDRQEEHGDGSIKIIRDGKKKGKGRNRRKGSGEEGELTKQTNKEDTVEVK